MQKIRWVRVLVLSFVCSVFILGVWVKIGSINKLSNKEYLGVHMDNIISDLGEELKGNEKYLMYEVNKKNVEVFLFNEKKVCVAHFQKMDSKFYKDIFEKLVVRKGNPVSAGNDVILFKDGTALEYSEKEINVKEYTKEFEKDVKEMKY